MADLRAVSPEPALLHAPSTLTPTILHAPPTLPEAAILHAPPTLPEPAILHAPSTLKVTKVSPKTPAALKQTPLGPLHVLKRAYSSTLGSRAVRFDMLNDAPTWTSPAFAAGVLPGTSSATGTSSISTLRGSTGSLFLMQGAAAPWQATAGTHGSSSGVPYIDSQPAAPRARARPRPPTSLSWTSWPRSTTRYGAARAHGSTEAGWLTRLLISGHLHHRTTLLMVTREGRIQFQARRG